MRGITFLLRYCAQRITLSPVPQTFEAKPESTDIKYVSLRISPDLHKKLKLLAVERDTCLQDLCVTAIERFLDIR